ncbi:MAG: hypothetical protein QM765_23810 [Myxococcales bacterium]
MTPEKTACAVREEIDRHFAGTIGPAAERSMREHLGTCADCHAYYGRHLLLAKLDPRSLGAKERLAKGLGVSLPRPNWWAGGALVLAGATAALLAVLAPRLATTTMEDGFTARGSGPVAAPPVELQVFQVVAGKAEPVAGRIADESELAFAYENRIGRSRLLVFATDERGQIYWFFPAWQDPAQDPESVAIERTEVPRELHEAVRHRFEGERLTLRAVFTDEVVKVQEVERRLKEGEPVSPGAHEKSTTLSVVHGGGR